MIASKEEDGSISLKIMDSKKNKSKANLLEKWLTEDERQLDEAVLLPDAIIPQRMINWKFS